MTSEIKPTAFKRGMPAEQKNGLFGLEQQLMESPHEPVYAVVTLRVDDIIDKELTGERYPIVEFDHIEPLLSEHDVDAAKRLQESAYKARTGANELSFDFSDVDDDNRGEGSD